MEHLEKNYLLAENQYGFRSNRSTKDALLSFSTQAYKAFNNGNCMLGIFIDFSKAFDTLDHDILINKLVNLKLGTNAIQWIKNYLSNRTQLTKIKTSFSNTKLIACGVPQRFDTWPYTLSCIREQFMQVFNTPETYFIC